MPRKLFDAEGAEIEVPDEADIAALNATIEELKEGVNPNWKETRAKLKELDDLKAKAKEIEGKTVISPEDIDRIATEKAEKVYLDKIIAKQLESVPEDKRESVKRNFDKLSSGESLDENKAFEFMQAASRAAGVDSQQNMIKRAAYSTGSGAPQFVDESKPQDFADTESGQKLSNMMGLTPLPKKQ